MATPDMDKERLWHSGPNFAADSVVMYNDEVLLIQRTDTGDWALPGGFINKDESPLTAARRELFEETGLLVSENGVNIYQGKVNDPRNSHTRWIETTAFVFDVSEKNEVSGKDDAQTAVWFPLDQLPDYLYGSHQEIVERALLWRAYERGEAAPVGSGHMSYDYELRITEAAGAMFTKRHVPQRHIDEYREAKSRLYLQKESSMLEALRENKYLHVPRYSLLFNDSLLAMEGLSEAEGWHWKAPQANTERYVRDCLGALSQLESVAIETDDTLTPSIISFLEEGWASIDNSKDLDRVRVKIDLLREQLHENTALFALKLRDNLESLRDQTLTMSIDFETTLSHHDARQANIAWHENDGVRLVDWSWAGPGLKNADTTSFIIDLAKSGYDVSAYMEEYFNPQYAKLLIGFWLGHSILPSKEGNEAVRLHQVASAATAYELLSL